MAESAPDDARMPPADLGEEWVPGPDGIPFRRGARVLLLDDDGALLLVEGHDGDDDDHRWWFTVGGGIAVGEDDRTAAAREVVEESGLTVAVADLVGPVATRSATFRFVRRTVRQDEVFFVARVPGRRPGTDAAGWTELERDVLDQMRWFSPDELDALVAGGATVYPTELPSLHRSLTSGWDGRCRHLTHE
ncbi:NUDIX hydrolase [Georgenia sp. Z1491]|uniref:NUDIX hydrolase n=1 Tax=Georgenia sp. Z1491 TaxID=3416707 RepID=UPI003CEA8768